MKSFRLIVCFGWILAALAGHAVAQTREVITNWTHWGCPNFTLGVSSSNATCACSGDYVSVTAYITNYHDGWYNGQPFGYPSLDASWYVTNMPASPQNGAGWTAHFQMLSDDPGKVVFTVVSPVVKKSRRYICQTTQSIEFLLKVDLDIDVDDDGDVDADDEAKEEIQGGIVFENWDNDDGDAAHTPDKDKAFVMGENDLVPIYLKFEPTLNTGMLKLEATVGGSRVKVWTRATKGADITLPKTWDLATETVPATLYLEGYDESMLANDVELRLSYTGGNSSICEDKFKITVVRLNLATVAYRELTITDNEWLAWLPPLGCAAFSYDHAGLLTAYNGQRTRQSLTIDANWEVMEMQSGIGIHTVSLADFKRPSPSSTLAYYGANRNPNSYENDSTRNALLYTANYMLSLVAPTYPSFLPAGIPKAIEYSSGNGFISDPVSVWALRCDALPEFVYEWVGVPLWSNMNTGHTSIRYFPEDHNNRPDCSIDADRELSPRAQWGGFGNENTTMSYIYHYQPGL